MTDVTERSLRTLHEKAMEHGNEDAAFTATAAIPELLDTIAQLRAELESRDSTHRKAIAHWQKRNRVLNRRLSDPAYKNQAREEGTVISAPDAMRGDSPSNEGEVHAARASSGAEGPCTSSQ